MEFHEHTLLHVPDLMLAVLRTAAAAEAQGRAAGIEDGVALLRANLKLADEDPPVDDAEIAARLAAVRDHLAAAGLLETADGRFWPTALGRRVLDENPGGVDDSVLERYVGRERLAGARPGGGPAAGGGAPAASAPPREAEYEDGASAFRAGRDISDNPHPLQTGQHQAWAAGWSEARDEETGPTGG